MKYKILTLVILIVLCGAFCAGTAYLPEIGDPQSVPNNHISDYYIEHSEEDTASPNIVSGTLADYRGYDTMYETSVMFVSGLVVTLLLAVNQKKDQQKKRKYDVTEKVMGAELLRPVETKRLKGIMNHPFGGIIIDVSARLIVPFSMMYAMYVLAAGEASPGGGFQAGAVLALGMVLGRLMKGEKASFKIPGAVAVLLAGIGAFFYVFTGWLSLFNGGMFLEYGKMPFPIGYHHLHEAGIFMIEAGVTLCVMMTIVGIMEALLKREDFEEKD